MGACPPRVQRASSANSASKFDNIGGWMGLEEPPHCPFEVIAACRGGGWGESIGPVGRDIWGGGMSKNQIDGPPEWSGSGGGSSGSDGDESGGSTR